MKQVISTEKKPIKSWVTDIEEGALEQAKNLANLPFIHKHIALMPDCHQGYGMPIGGVMAAKGVVIPNAVGVDIGCGMISMKTSLTDIDTDTIKKIMGGSKEFKGGIRGKIPVGFNHHKKDQSWNRFDNAPDIEIIQRELKSARKQIGSLGGGNHFIEIQKGDDNFIYIMVHSGSRNFGFQIAKIYNKLAQKLCKRWYSNIPEFKGEDGLAFLPIETKEGKEYMTAMNYALEFAFGNRMIMIEYIKESFSDVIKCEFCKEVNIHHNYAIFENHFNENIIVHRKGATSAKKGQIGIIPGSQGTASYIVEGLGNEDSFKSCSHGAGRLMSRKKARDILNLEEEKKKLDNQGIIHSVRNKCNLDEASGAYKNIDDVMNNQNDLVKIVTKLTPLAVIKG